VTTERLRDPTHVRCYSEDEWKAMLTEVHEGDLLGSLLAERGEGRA